MSSVATILVVLNTSPHEQVRAFLTKKTKMIFDFRLVHNFLIYTTLLVVFHVGWIMKGIPVLKGVIAKTFDKILGICLPSELYWESLFGRQMLATLWRVIQIDMNKTIKQLEIAFNFPVIVLDENNNENKTSNLFAHVVGNRPLVLNFGSCTCPVFTHHLDEFRSIVKEFEDVADFVLVYIEEAHPADGWALQVILKNTYIFIGLFLFFVR
jgi:hypothetical protein